MRTSVKGGKEEQYTELGCEENNWKGGIFPIKKTEAQSFLRLLDPMSLGRKGRKKKYGDAKYPHRVIGDSGLWK